jgi:hypothetical protein
VDSVLLDSVISVLSLASSFGVLSVLFNLSL